MRPKLVVVAILGLVLSIALIFIEDTSGGLNPEHNKRFSSGPDVATSSETAADDFIKNQSEDLAMRWFCSDTQGELKGVALVIHGLNLRPDRMQPIITKLTESGIDVLGLSLRGHGENYTHSDGIDEDQARLESFKNVTYQLWMNEAYLAYLLLKERGAEKGVPLFLTAFSLGGLIGLDLFASNADVQFDRLVLFAPAIRLHATIYLERLLSPFPRLVIPSMAPKTYLANKKGTPIAAYNALFDGLNRFNQKAGQKLNIPTLICIDEQDEFIPLRKLKKLVEEKGWNQWQFYIVNKDKSARDETFYHHIIDASSTGKTVWQDMITAVVDHLLDIKDRPKA
ncbi:MAG: alpha/beta hydrolase [Deltaproteobacteria bacterium]|jgi:alpha-beta hydrolase superfamily lysophospholipase|nr:alpha/beta hydrolase [Deltaproteobacteria bacterium]